DGKRGLLTSYGSLAALLDVNKSKIKRLLSGNPEHFHNMQLGEVQRIASELGISPGEHLPKPDEVRLFAETSLLARMRAVRHNLANGSGPGPNDVEEVAKRLEPQVRNEL